LRLGLNDVTSSERAPGYAEKAPSDYEFQV